MTGAAARHRYDLVLDSFCLQSVVTDSDRRKLFASVRDRLKPVGFYEISTAMHDPARRYEEDELYDATTGVCYALLPGGDRCLDGDVQRDGAWYRPHRRHLTAPALRGELKRAGFGRLWQGGELGGDVVCARGDIPLPTLFPA